MSFMDKAKEAAEKFKDSDNEQVNKVKDKINEYTGGEDNKDKKDKRINKKSLIILRLNSYQQSFKLCW